MAQDNRTRDFVQRVLDEGPALDIAEQRQVTVRAFSTNHPWDRPALMSGLRGAYLPEDRDIGVLMFISDDTSRGIRIVVGKQGDKRFRRYDHASHNVEVYAIKNVITDHATVQYQEDEDGMVRFITVGGGSQLTAKALNGFHTFALGIDDSGVEHLTIRPDRMRKQALSERFVGRLYAIKARTSHEGYASIDHAQFKSKKYIDPDCERMQDLRGDEQLVVESFESDVEFQTGSLSKAIMVRFEVTADSGSIKLRFPSIPWNKQLKSLHQRSLAFYELVEAALENILGTDFFVRVAAVDGVGGLDLFFPTMTPTGAIKDQLRSPGLRRTHILDHIDPYGTEVDWVPWARALDELSAQGTIAKDVTESLTALASEDPYRLLELLRGSIHFKYRALGACCFDALRASLDTLPATLSWDATRLLAAWLVWADTCTWQLDPERDAVLAEGIPFDLDMLPKDGQAAVVRAGLRSALTSSEAWTEAEEASVAWAVDTLRRLGSLAEVEEALLDGTLTQDRTRVEHLVGSEVAELGPADLEAAACARLGMPVLPRIELVGERDERALVNTGLGTATNVAASPGPDQPALTAGQLDPGARWPLMLTLLHADQIHVRYTALGRPAERVLGATLGEVVPIAERRRRAPKPQHLTKLRALLDPNGQLAGCGLSMLPTLRQLYTALETGQPVLLTGETGVGKTTIARLLHDAWQRSGTFLRVSGASSGGDAIAQRGEWLGFSSKHGIQDMPPNHPGYVVQADGGTLFVDDVDALSPQLQALLLDPIEGRPFKLVGGDSRSADVRFIFATNQPVSQLRGDLVARFKVTVELPPLRDRADDLLEIVRAMASRLDANLSFAAWLALVRHTDWPANMRGIEAAITAAKSSATLDDRKKILVDDLAEHLPDDLLDEIEALGEDGARAALWRHADAVAGKEGHVKGTGRQRRAGEIMGVGPSTASEAYKAFNLGLSESA